MKDLVALIKNGNAQNIRGQKIGRELNTFERGIHRAGEGLGQGGFAGAGKIFQQDMPAAGQRGQ